MIKKIILAIVAITIVVFGLFLHKQNKLTTADYIENAVDNYLTTGQTSDFISGRHLDKLELFKEKFEAENFPAYRLDSFQAENDNIVYIMLIVDPGAQIEKGIVLYMNFYLKSESPIEIDKLIISNWVNILNKAKQF